LSFLFSSSLLLFSPVTWCVYISFLSSFISFYLSVYSYFFPATFGASYIFLHLAWGQTASACWGFLLGNYLSSFRLQNPTPPF
jgi:hypothetical protein